MHPIQSVISKNQDSIHEIDVLCEKADLNRIRLADSLRGWLHATVDGDRAKMDATDSSYEIVAALAQSALNNISERELVEIATWAIDQYRQKYC